MFLPQANNLAPQCLVFFLHRAMAPIAATGHAKNVFKFVTGVLNNAFLEDRLIEYEADIRALMSNPPEHLQFENACDALASAIAEGHVPAKGLEVVKSLLKNTKVASCALYKVVGMTSEKDHARHLFRFVSGTLNSVLVDACEENIKHWIPEANGTKFSDACDALACAIADDLVPEQSIEILALLAQKCSTHSISAKLRSLLPMVDDVISEDEEDEIEELPEQRKAPSEANQLFKFVTAILHGMDADVPCIPGVKGFGSACNLLADCIKEGKVPRQGLDALIKCRRGEKGSDNRIQQGTDLDKALMGYLCPRCEDNMPRGETCDLCRGTHLMKCGSCSGTGEFSDKCRGCDGTGRGRTRPACPVCGGSGRKVLGTCRSCQGSKTVACYGCVQDTQFGVARPCCKDCVKAERQAAERQAAERQAARSQGKGKGKGGDGPPEKGVSISRCAAGDLSRLQDLWTSRQGGGKVVDVWKVDNPLLTYKFKQRRDELKQILGREADVIEGFHGSAPSNYLSIVDTGFREDLRGTAVGQVFGRGEYMACNPNVSVGYCRGGEYMLVCRLILGVQSSTPDNHDGDHIWVPSNKYYVIAKASQILPQFLIKFANSSQYGSPTSCPKLEDALLNGYSTKPPAEIIPVPPQRPCLMQRPTASVLWMGFLHGHHSDEALKQDVEKFLQSNASEYVKGVKIQIVKGHFKKAHAILQTPMPRRVVKELNSAPFFERGSRRTMIRGGSRRRRRTRMKHLQKQRLRIRMFSMPYQRRLRSANCMLQRCV